MMLPLGSLWVEMKKETIFKGILTLIGAALFVVQLSDKFYLFANKPFCHIAAKRAHHKIVSAVKPGLAKDSYHFSPDRRFHSGNGFALLSPIFVLRPCTALDKPEFYTTDEPAVASAFPATSLRGPPES